MSLFVSMYFRFKLDIKENFTKQNGEWVFISVFFSVINSFDTQREKSFSFICYYITLFDHDMHFLNNT